MLSRGDLSLFLRHMSKSAKVRGIFEAFLLDRDGVPSTEATRRTDVFRLAGNASGECDNWGWFSFVERTKLDEKYVTDGHITFVCAILVVSDSPICVPSSDIGVHLGSLLDSMEGTDVSFTIDGETFCAHRAVLAARSPVFRAELFGSMAEAKMPSITVHDMAPAAFRLMLQFMYTDALPGEDEIGDSPIEMFQDLLAVADRYALDRLKHMCAQKLWDNLSVDTVATTLACAETYNCRELKDICFDFFAVEKNFKEAVFTNGFALLVQKYPCISAELKEKVKT